MLEMAQVFDSDGPFIYRLNDNGSGPSLLVKVFTERGWRTYQGFSNSEERWNLWWRTSAFPATSYKALGDWQFMNHIPKGGSICRKDSLSRLLRCMRRIYGSIYDFSPSYYNLPYTGGKGESFHVIAHLNGATRLLREARYLMRSNPLILPWSELKFQGGDEGESSSPPCFHLPLEYAKLVSECSRLKRGDDSTSSNVVWIHKPVAQSQGRGIFLFRSVCDMRCGSPAVVQRYIERPLLVAGYKFDLRLYVCVPGYRPLTAYMYAEGLARFGTDKYTLSDIHNPYRHLTNSSLNKTGPRYAECKDRIGSGCKWTLKQVRRALVGRWGAAEWLVWQRIRALVTLTLLAQAAGTPPARNCFEFYGFDVLLDDCLKPWLIEVNLSPALAADCEADVTVKQPMLHELFDLLGLPMRHTGLSLLQGPPAPHISYSSEEENGSGKTVVRVPLGHRSGRRVRSRRRRAMPLHRVTLQAPVTDVTDLEKTKDIQTGRLYKMSSDVSPESSETQCSTAVISSTEPVDESWRGGYSTAASRRRMMNACSWGNGVRWDRGVGRVGHWVRIYPHSLPADDQLPVEDVRESVAQVSKFLRAAREVAREGGRDKKAPRDGTRDSVFEAALRKKLQCDNFEIWLPPF